MAKVNKKVLHKPQVTHGGAVVDRNSYYNEFKRTIMACMLWEDTHYESGISIADRIKELVPKIDLEKASESAIYCRQEMKLRHVPLLIVREMARHPKLALNPWIIRKTLQVIIQRPDEINEFLAIYWKDGKTPISAQVKKGLAAAFNKFNEYSFAKFKNDGQVKQRDVMFLTHPKPDDLFQKNGDNLTLKESLFQKIANNTLEIPDTWEVALSGGKNKKETFETLMTENKLGALAFLKNLRGMLDAGVSEDLIREYSKTVNTERVLPFRFISAAKHAPKLEDMLEDMMYRCVENLPKVKGKTLLIIDTSGSMRASVSSKSDLSRLEASGALAILARELCENVVIYATAGNDSSRIHKTMIVPPRRGFALSSLFVNNELAREIGLGGIFLKQCMDYISEIEQNKIDRVIVFTDEQDCDTGVNPKTAKILGKYNYIFNIGSNKNGINSDKWTTITGFSEKIFDYIQLVESEN